MALRPIFARLRYLVEQEGWRAIPVRIHRRFLSRGHAAYLRWKADDDRAFDAAHGVDTGGVQHGYRLDATGEAVASATSHIAIPEDDFRAAISAIDIPIADAAFVDLGSGKGRALLLAAGLRFRRIIGVEFAPSLQAIARANIARRGIATAGGDPIELIDGDAAAFAFPDGAVVLFLYHPFGPPVMTRVAENSLAAWRSGSRPMQVAYVNPVHLDPWLRLGWRVAKRAPTHVILDPPEA